MGPFAVGGIVFASLFGGAILGMTLGAACRHII
jgi:H+/Cl- antiporter ClcA